MGTSVVIHGCAFPDPQKNYVRGGKNAIPVGIVCVHWKAYGPGVFLMCAQASCTRKPNNKYEKEATVMCWGRSCDKNLPGTSTPRHGRPDPAEEAWWQKHPSLGTAGSGPTRLCCGRHSPNRVGGQREECRAPTNGRGSTVDWTIDAPYRTPSLGLMQSVGHRCVLLSVSTMVRVAEAVMYGTFENFKRW